MQMSAKIERGMVRLSASVPISDDVRKQPLWGIMKKQKNQCWVVNSVNMLRYRKTLIV